MTRSKWVLWLCLLIVLAIFAVPVLEPRLPKVYTTLERHICSQCGIRRWTTSKGVVGSSMAVEERHTLEQTELSRWFASNISAECRHTWQFNHSTRKNYIAVLGIRLWQYSGSTGSSATPPIVDLRSDDLAQLEKLLRENREACRQFIARKLRKKPDPDE